MTSTDQLVHGAEADLSRRRTNWIIATVAVYAGTSLIANVMSVRIVTILGYSIDAGTLTYPLTFTLRDMIHKAGGKQAARTAIVTTAFLNVGMVLCFLAAAKLPPDLSVGAQREFGQVLAVTWRIVAASVTAQVIAELADTEVYQRFVDRFGGRLQFGRVLTSNAVSVPLDSVIFTLIAFAGDVPTATIVEIVVVNIVIKGISSLATAPLIYAVPDWLGRTGQGGTATDRVS